MGGMEGSGMRLAGAGAMPGCWPSQLLGSLWVQPHPKVILAEGCPEHPSPVAAPSTPQLWVPRASLSHGHPERPLPVGSPSILQP